MEEMIKKFKKEYRSVFMLYLEANNLVDDTAQHPENYDEEQKRSAWHRYKCASGRRHEIRKIARIFGYTYEDTVDMEDEFYKDYKQGNI